MSATTTPTLTTTAGPSLQQTPRVPLTRLIRVELRKLWDTRAGFWLLAGIGLITAAVIVIFMFAGEAEELTFSNFVNATSWPQAILLPVLGILAVTSEWGQRTALVTFTLEPHRGRIVVAKLVATLALGAVAVVVALSLAAVANVVAAVGLDGDGSWTFGVAGARDILVNQLISVLQGVAFGMLIMNSAAAIVAYFALPTLWGVLTATVQWFADIGRWVDLNTTSTPLAMHEMDGDAWVRLGVSVSIWVLLPIALGVVRLLRREVKSA
jgi:ABC-2 type transport system permease protein